MLSSDKTIGSKSMHVHHVDCNCRYTYPVGSNVEVRWKFLHNLLVMLHHLTFEDERNARRKIDKRIECGHVM